MKITHIHVTAGRGFNHPYEQYANFKFDLHLQATLEEGEAPKDCIIHLQAEAEAAAEQHKQRILNDCKRLRLIEEGNRELERLRVRAKQQEDLQPEIAKTEEMLTKLTSQPLMLGSKIIHPGHSDHPETDENDWEYDPNRG